MCSKRKTIEEFKKEIFDKFNGEYIVISDKYINNKTPILVKHVKCGNSYFVKPNGILYKNKCPFCANEKRGIGNIKENYLEDILINCNEEENYKWLENYKNNNKIKHKILHKKCNNVYEVRPNDFQQGYRCPYCADCNNSKNIKLIENYLVERNIKFEKEFKFNNCKNKRILPFDLKIGNLILEYDGSQHFFSNGKSYMKKSLERNKINDKIKNEFMFNSSYDFLRINYKNKFNVIKQILDEYFKNNCISIETLNNNDNILFKNNSGVFNLEKYYTL